ncbi:hypothetical protein FB45DRAFT_1029465 [Roridomyces roridus]|uniref:No apical meristem-associated C-terminal domain-containing protein n=1 Tax=Roridomyces roridus TaxID=1738132 RepID=A0AAD7BQB2_9AGAR|nr:hypothetical protein FB45DRAFT_1029465 [Roridomyces roridus]
MTGRIRSSALVGAASMDTRLPGDNPFKDKERGEKDVKAVITAIEDSPALTNALFPSCGQNESSLNGGGMKKAEAYYKCAEAVWSKRFPEYFKALATGPKGDREAVWSKVKNLLVWLTKETQKHKKRMEGTRSGNEMTQDELDQLPHDDERRSAWGGVLAEFPYYFRMTALLSDRPNWEPVSLGNTESDDITHVAGFSAPPPYTTLGNSTGNGSSVDGDGLVDDEDGLGNAGINDDDDDSDDAKKRKRRGSHASSTIVLDDDADADADADTKPKADVKPAAKKSKYASDLVELANAEERTQHKRLDVALKDIDAERARAQADEVHSRHVLGPKAQAALVREQRKSENDEFKRKMQLLEAREKYGDAAVNEMYGTSFGLSGMDLGLYLPPPS